VDPIDDDEKDEESYPNIRKSFLHNLDVMPMVFSCENIIH